MAPCEWMEIQIRWCNPKSHLEVDKWQERKDNSLDPCLTNRWGEGEKKKIFLERERESLLYL